MILLMPSNPLNINEIDPFFIEEYEAALLVGFKVILFDFDKFVNKNILKLNIKTANESIILYRGWMMTYKKYRLLWLYESDRKKNRKS